MTGSRFAALVVLSICVSLSGAPEASAQAADPMQRSFVFKNDTPVPIYPVISGPKNANCEPGNDGMLRIVVNAGQRDAGIAPGGTVTVQIPKEYPCKNGGFYNASRVYILLANPIVFEKNIDPPQRTVPIPATGPNPPPTNLCPGDNVCWVGAAATDYVGDFPGQLLEYTIISQVNGEASPNGPNDRNGIPLIDFDVSYVDSAYLPVAMALGDGMTAYMGSALPYDQFKLRLTTFLDDPRTDWSAFGVYAQRNWERQTLFGPAQNPGLTLDRIDKLPSGNVVVVSTRPESVGFSPYYQGDSAVPPPNYQFPACNDGQHNLACFQFNHLSSGNCCPVPNTSGQLEMLGCCDVQNFLVDRTLATWVANGTGPGGNLIPLYTYANPTFTNMVERWAKWRASDYSCAESAPPPATPALDPAGFCSTFQRTIDFVWEAFSERGNCGNATGEVLTQCVVAAILGYDLKDADPAKCAKCPGEPCPGECVVDIQLNQSVQALLRSVPWTPAGGAFGGATCGGCPSTDPSQCSLMCVAPQVYASDATIWHFDKFLHFWAPYDSPYNLNPFARFVHVNDPTKTEGLDAPGAYSFSIDDFYGNFGGVGSTLIIDVGGTSALINKSPYDPYTQYFVGVAPGWASAEVCGREVRLQSPTSGQGTNVAFSFWAADGSGRKPTCDITLYADAAKTEFVTFQLQELPFTVHDNYTGQDHPVFGLGGVFAVRQGEHLAVPDNAYCCRNSSPSLAGRGKCQANLTPGFLNLAYVAVTECEDPSHPTCGRPLMTLAVPALSGGAPGTTCQSVPVAALLAAIVSPSSRAVPVGGSATFVATITNAGIGTATQVGIALASIQSQARLAFNAVDCATNAVIGATDAPVDIAPGDQACFVMRLTPTVVLDSTEVAFTFAGTNAPPAPTLIGVNTVTLLAPLIAGPDVIALAATASGDVVLTLPAPPGSGAFSVATANVGAAGRVTARATSHGLVPLRDLVICESDPRTAACTAPPAASVTMEIGAGQTPTFSVFATAAGPIDPASAPRIFVEFSAGGVVVGRTSVAVRAP